MEKPQWIEKFKQPGTQIVRQKENYYLYKVERVYDFKINKSKKKTTEYLGKLTPEGLKPPKHKQVFKPLDIDKTNNLLKKIQIICDLKANVSKKTIAKSYNITTKTVTNIEKRFEKEGVNGLIHNRKSNVETVKVSTPEQASIITDVIKNPDKSPKEIKETLGIKTDLSSIKKLIYPIKEHLKLKKKIKIEIE
jgi:transposase